jgi:hypothetical protein
MDSLRYQANVIYEAADRGICGADVGRYRSSAGTRSGASLTVSGSKQNVVDEAAYRGICGADVGKGSTAPSSISFRNCRGGGWTVALMYEGSL